MKPKHHVFLLKSDLYPHKVVFCIGPRPSEAECGKITKRFRLWNGRGRPPYTGEDSNASTITFGGGCMVWLPRTPKTPDDLGSFMHEMIHVAVNAGEQMGCQIRDGSEEFHAYYIGWLTRQFFGRTAKRNFKKQSTK